MDCTVPADHRVKGRALVALPESKPPHFPAAFDCKSVFYLSTTRDLLSFEAHNARIGLMIFSHYFRHCDFPSAFRNCASSPVFHC